MTKRPDATEVGRVLDACAALLAPLPALEQVEVICALMRIAVGRARSESPADDDDGPDSVPEGAEGRGPGWVVLLEPRGGGGAPGGVSVASGSGGTGGGAGGGGYGEPAGISGAGSIDMDEMRNLLVPRDPITGERPWCEGPPRPDMWRTCARRSVMKHAGHVFCAECAIAFERLRKNPTSGSDRKDG